MENGEIIPKPERVEKVAELLGVSPDQIKNFEIDKYLIIGDHNNSHNNNTYQVDPKLEAIF